MFSSCEKQKNQFIPVVLRQKSQREISQENKNKNYVPGLVPLGVKSGTVFSFILDKPTN